MDKLKDTPGYHRFRIRRMLPFAFILNIVMFVQSISDAITLSYLYLIDAGMCLCWFALAIRVFSGFLRHKESAYRWNIGYEAFMLAFLASRMVLYLVLVRDRSIGLILLFTVFICFHIWEATWYHEQRDIFTKL